MRGGTHAAPKKKNAGLSSVRVQCACAACGVHCGVQLIQGLYANETAVCIALRFALAAGMMRVRVVAKGDGQWVIAGRGSAVTAVGVVAANSAMRCPLFGVAVPGFALGSKKDFAVAKVCLCRFAPLRKIA